MEKERYVCIHNLAQVDRKQCKDDAAMLDISVKNSELFEDRDERNAYLCSFLIPDDNDFLVNYGTFNKDSNKLSKKYLVPIGIIAMKSMLMQKFGPVTEKADQASSLKLLTEENAFLKRRTTALTEENAKLLAIISSLEDELEQRKEGRVK